MRTRRFRTRWTDSITTAMSAQSALVSRYVLEHARVKDAMTLWHLITRTDAADRSAVVDALDQRAPMPLGVTRDTAINVNQAALDLWWDSLGLQDASWWRKWKQ